MSGFCGSNDSIRLRVEKDSGDSIRIPLGYRFSPTDEELINHFLRRKIEDPSFFTTAIEEADFNRLEPGGFLGERKRFFFCQRYMLMMYATWQRRGFWKSTGEDREIFKGKTLIGMKKTLIFYRGSGERTDWVMHEYRLEGDNSLNNLPQNAKNEWVICKVFLKNSLENRTFGQYLHRMVGSKGEGGGGNPREMKMKNDQIALLQVHFVLLEFILLYLMAIEYLGWASEVLKHYVNIKRKDDNNDYVGGVRQLKPKLTTHNVNCCRSSTLKTKDDNNEYVGGVRQLQPKLQKSNYTTMEDNSRVCVKVRYNNDTVMFLLPFPTMDSLKAEILKRFSKLEAQIFKIRYKDGDEEMVTIACDEDLHYCLEFFKSTGTTPVRLSILKESSAHSLGHV